MDETAIRTEKLTREFGRLCALDGVTLDMPPGTVTALLGPNGAGKTTLIRLLLGLIEPTDGQAWMLGQSARALPSDVCARVVGMGEGHEPPRRARLTHLVDLQEGASAKFDRSRAMELLAEHGIRPRSRYGALSKGQKRWTLASLTLASGAEVLLLDEPADGMDPAARRRLYDHLREYVNRSAATVLVATHIISDIERVADEVAILRRGRLALHQSLEDLREQVREIELHGTTSLPSPVEGYELLGTKTISDTLVMWVRCTTADNEDLQNIGGVRASVRHVDLETLYLVLTEHRIDTEGVMEQEIQG